jgi:hypothetical protein
MRMSRLLGSYENSEFDFYLSVKQIFMSQGFLMDIGQHKGKENLYKKSSPLNILFDFYFENTIKKYRNLLTIAVFYDDELMVVGQTTGKIKVFKILDFITPISSRPIAFNGVLRPSELRDVSQFIFEFFQGTDTHFILSLNKSGKIRKEYESSLGTDSHLDYLDFENIIKQPHPFLGDNYRFRDFGFKDLLDLHILYNYVANYKCFSKGSVANPKDVLSLIKNTTKRVNKLKRAQKYMINLLKKKKSLNLRNPSQVKTIFLSESVNE